MILWRLRLVRLCTKKHKTVMAEFLWLFAVIVSHVLLPTFIT